MPNSSAWSPTAILQQVGIDGLDARPSEEASRGKDLRAKHLAYYRSYMQAWNRIYWDNDRNTRVAHGEVEAGPEGREEGLVFPQLSTFTERAEGSGDLSRRNKATSSGAVGPIGRMAMPKRSRYSKSSTIVPLVPN